QELPQPFQQLACLARFARHRASPSGRAAPLRNKEDEDRPKAFGIDQAARCSQLCSAAFGFATSQTTELVPGADPTEGLGSADRDDDGRVDAEALEDGEAREAVAGKEWEGDLLRPVLPPAPALDEGQKGLDVPLDQLIFHDLLVAGARPDHVPGHPELTVSRDLGR